VKENRSIFSKDVDNSIVSPFFDSRCRYSNSAPSVDEIQIFNLMTGLAVVRRLEFQIMDAATGNERRPTVARRCAGRDVK